VDEIYLGGGGSYNPNIVNYLKQRMPNTRITYVDETGSPVGAKEAQGFALLTHECFIGRPMIVPKNTESDNPGVVGQTQPGKNMHRIRQAVAQASLYPRHIMHHEPSFLIISSFGTTSPRRTSGVP
jgi:hypothetical protein